MIWRPRCDAETRSKTDRTALLSYCTREEAELIRTAAKRERRAISGFVMNSIMSRFVLEGYFKKDEITRTT